MSETLEQRLLNDEQTRELSTLHNEFQRNYHPFKKTPEEEKYIGKMAEYHKQGKDVTYWIDKYVVMTTRNGC